MKSFTYVTMNSQCPNVAGKKESNNDLKMDLACEDVFDKHCVLKM